MKRSLILRIHLGHWHLLPLWFSDGGAWSTTFLCFDLQYDDWSMRKSESRRPS